MWDRTGGMRAKENGAISMGRKGIVSASLLRGAYPMLTQPGRCMGAGSRRALSSGAVCEPLEARLFLSTSATPASVTVPPPFWFLPPPFGPEGFTQPGTAVDIVQPTVVNGSLEIDGNDEADDIYVSQDGYVLYVFMNDRQYQYEWVTDVRIVAGAGDDFVGISANVALDVTVAGGSGGDALAVLCLPYARNAMKGYLFRGGSGNDGIYGGDGNDILLGGGGDDHISGGAGDDSLRGGAGSDAMAAETGDDIATGGPGNDLIVDSVGHDTLLGGSGDDRIASSDHDRDLIDGGAGYDCGDDLSTPDAIVSVEQQWPPIWRPGGGGVITEQPIPLSLTGRNPSASSITELLKGGGT
jgi:hypothetical protein